MHMNKQEENFLKNIFKNIRLSSDDNLIEVAFDALACMSKLKPNVSKKDNPLTRREMMCLILLAIGNNPDKCADMLGITTNSVTTYEQRIRKKLGARNRTHALYLASVKRYILIDEEISSLI